MNFLENHIYVIKTQHPETVEGIQQEQKDIILERLNWYTEEIEVGDVIFLVFGGDKPKWTTGFAALAHVTQAPFEIGYEKKNFKIKIDIDIYFQNPIKRGDFVSYPATFDVISIGPSTKGEPNQAINRISKTSAIAVLQALIELRPDVASRVKALFGDSYNQLDTPVRRYVESVSPLGAPVQSFQMPEITSLNLKEEFIEWGNISPRLRKEMGFCEASLETITKYAGYIETINNENVSSSGLASGSGWSGLYEYVNGSPAKLSCFEIDSVEEFDSVYGFLFDAIENKENPANPKYESVRNWFNNPEIKKHGCLASALKAYKSFLIWREDKPFDADALDKLIAALKTAGLQYDDAFVKRFVCALLAKPFVILTGLSGSGKTKLAQAFAKWIGVENTVLVVPVGADWTNNERLLGFPNALDEKNYVLPDTGVLKFIIDAKNNPNLPFFLILDEMNLSHVERYFADFLSAMESEEDVKLHGDEVRYASDGMPIEPKLKFPANLFIIGTMNVDETTYMFSPKVLDRAQVLEFRVDKDDIETFLSSPTKPNLGDLAGKGARYAEAFLTLAKERKTKELEGTAKDAVKNALTKFFPGLANLGAEFGYRTASEIVTFVAYYLEASGYKPDDDQKSALQNEAIDVAILQKLLPKLHGSRNRLEGVLDVLITATKGTDEEEEKVYYALTKEKLERMKMRLVQNNFTSFAEA